MLEMSEEKIIAESYSNLKSAILLGRTDIVRGILSTAAESRLENGFFDDEEEEEDGEDFRIKKYDEDYDDNPYDILRVMLNYVDSDAGTALHLATKLGNADITRALLSAGADPTRPNKEGSTPFEYCTDESILKVYNEQLLEAAAHNQLVKLQRLLNAGVSANATDGAATNNRALHWAASFGGHEAVKLLCEHNADPNITNSGGSTPIFDAVKRKNKEIVTTLLSYGARTDITLTEGSHKGKTPLDLVPDGSEIKELLLSPPPRIIPEKASTEVNVCPADSDIVNDSNTSSLSSLAESKTDVQIPNSEDDKNTSARELDLAALWPYPQQLTLIKGSHYFPEAYLSIRIVMKGEEDPHYIHDMWRAVDESFKKLGFSIRVLFVSEDISDYSNVPGCITCTICPLLFSRTESYTIHISSQKISLCANEPRSLWYSINTLLQLFKLSKGVGIPQMQINDWPDLKYRAFFVDVGHGRSLNSDSLLFLVDTLSNLKYNQMVLCLQNSFQFANHFDVLKNSSPYTQSDILKLDRYCRKRYIELIPYMDHISDFSKWLKHDKYKHLGETAANISGKPTNRSSGCLAPVKIDPTNFVRDLNKQLCSSFSSARFVHLGVSVPDEIGAGASEEECETKGKESILLNHLRSVNESCEIQRKIAMFWANSFHDHIRQGNEMPPGMIAMDYGGKPGYRFDVFCKLCSDYGLPYYVCPGTMSWSSLVGAVYDSIDLIDEAVQSAVNYNALGILITDWSAYGSVTPIEASMSAFAVGAALSWNSKMKQESAMSSLAKVLDLHVFQDEAGLLGQVLQNLSEVHKLLDLSPVRTESDDQSRIFPEDKPENASLLLQLLLFPSKPDAEQLSSDNVQKASRCLRKCQASLPKVQMKCRRASAIVKQLDLMIDMALYACRVGRALALIKSDEKSEGGFTIISSLPNITRTDLANRLLGIIENYRRVWGLSNRPGGLEESVEVLQRAFEEIVPSSTVTV